MICFFSGSRRTSKPGHRVERTDEDRGQHNVEGHMKFGGHLRHVRLERQHFACDRRQERHGDDDADEAVEEVARGQPPRRRIAADAGFDQRIDGAAEIGAEHQRQRGLRGDELRIGKRHDQQHDRDAGMRRPGQRSGDDDAQHRIIGDGSQQRPHRRRLFGRRQRVEQDMQRQQRQAEPDGDTARPPASGWSRRSGRSQGR